MSLIMSLKDAWSSDESSHRTRLGYKKKLIQQTRQETVKEIVMDQIANVLK
jgi:hypothetical protein